MLRAWIAPHAVLALWAACAVGGCSQTAHLHLARGAERLHTPSHERTSKDDSQHATVAAAQSQNDCDGAKVKAYNHRVCCTHVQRLVAPETVAELEKEITS